MKIKAYRRQFLSDHSSTNYLFYSSKSLSPQAQASVSKLNSHVNVSARKAEVTYHGDFADMKSDRRLKFLRHFPVNVRESYDWWDLVIVLEKAQVDSFDLPEKYGDCEGQSRLTFTTQSDSLILWFEGAHLDYSTMTSMSAVARLGIKIRNEIHKGKLSAVDVMANYCVGPSTTITIRYDQVGVI